ncbi:3-oxoacyl-[acyl-carrier-protein] reductase [Cucumibacter marinus]|uniref:3-oxoacyl-[acyl-carrier-protein] reductase n=1 Tax=Cucumibacter marinus TaxID=1121252 RepID=UPI00040C67C0|nr:3-oxoacyl-[acyl-carrier-protein] reductase [Cucumibacter marinus]
MFDLTGKRALVTGASGGIGRSIALALAEQGATVALSGTNQERLAQTAEAIKGESHTLTCNLADRDAVEALVPAAMEAMGGIDILVNNAGLTRDNIFIRLKDEDWDTVIEVNLTAAFKLSRAATKAMLRQRWGRIIQITSVVAVDGNGGQGNYAASKAGLIGMSKSLAKEVATRGITVNSIAPGFITSAMTDMLNDKQRQVILDDIPMARLGTPEEIAAAAVYLSSQEAAYVTGQTLHVNGGAVLV